MKIVGLNSCTHDSSISLIENNIIKGSFQEERFTRVKAADNIASVPNLSLDNIQKYFNFNIMDDDVVLATSSPVHKHDFVMDILNKKNIFYYPHHLSHAAGAYFTSGFKEKTMVLVMDGSESNNFHEKILTKDNIKNLYYNNGTYATVFTGENNKLTEIYKSKGGPKNESNVLFNVVNPMASLWGEMCHIFKWKENKDEGKIMGLAAQGHFDKKIYDLFKYGFQYSNLEFDLYAANTFGFMLGQLDDMGLFKDPDIKKNVSYIFQKLTEDRVLEYIWDLYKRFPGHKKICLAGGLFANVKLNQRINEYGPFEEIYVMPPMGDCGISIGAALMKANEDYGYETKRWDNVFLGIGYTQDEMDSFVDFSKYDIYPYSPKIIARILQEGKVVGTFTGRSEYGPRALGSRSILVEPTKNETHEYLNKKLDRHEIMPFAPIVMSEHVSDIMYAYRSIRTAEFMTLCYTVKDEWADKIPAVINVYDKTCRPQIVFKERNEFFHGILDEFNKLTGLPILLNTSFNSHGEPIINHPSHAIKHLDKGSIDYLIMGNKILKKK